MAEPLTDLERRVLDFLVDHLRRHTYQPSLREIGGRLGIRSTRKVSEILTALAGKGWIERTAARSRSVRLLATTDGGPPTVVAAETAAAFEDARPEDALWMERALEQARVAVTVQEVPVGAVLVRDGELIAEVHNLTRTLGEPTAHAEMVAIRRGASRGEGRLPGTTLYVTLEPCAMCAGAIVLAKVERLVYAASDPKTGMCGSLGCIVQDRRLNHRVRLTRGVLADAAGELLREFFRVRR